MHHIRPTGDGSRSGETDGDTLDPPTDEQHTEESCLPTVAVGRRQYLGLVGASAAASLVGSRPAAAQTEQGYGSGEYGLGTYGFLDGSGDTTDPQDTSLEVTTVTADVQETSATLSGYLSMGEDLDSVTVSFEYRQSDADQWTATDGQVVSSGGAFEQLVSDLSPATAYEYRALAASATESVRGESLSFRTLDPEAAPSVDTFVVEDLSDSNAEIELAIEWAVSDADGDLETVTVVVADYRRTLSWDEIDVSGSSARGLEEVRAKRKGAKTFEVTVAVTDAAGNLDVQRTQLG